MKKLFTFLIPFVFAWSTCISIEFIKGGPYISKATEDKYLRNIHTFSWINDRLCYTYGGMDSLSGIGTTPFSIVDPFHKWYILDEVGNIDPKSRLSKVLDSLSNNYVEAPNKFK